jgi:hypothetical protein|nr:MAG TPA: hypothetical protein [Caudoviricetes sp.]
MHRIDPYELKYGNPDWCHDAQPDGQKVVTSLLEDFRANPDQYLSSICFQDEQTGQVYYLEDATSHGWPFVATLHDHVDHTNLHVRWWIGGKEYVCEFKLTTNFMTAGEETPVPELAFTLLESGVYDIGGSAGRAAGEYLKLRFFPCPCTNERVDMWWSLTGRMDQTMWHLALLPEAACWMQLS